MEYNDILNNFKFILSKALESGLFNNIDNARYVFELFDKISNVSYDTREAYDEDVKYIFSLANTLHTMGKFTFEESYVMYMTFIELEHMNLNSGTNFTYEPVSANGEISYEELIGAVDRQQ